MLQGSPEAQHTALLVSLVCKNQVCILKVELKNRKFVTALVPFQGQAITTSSSLVPAYQLVTTGGPLYLTHIVAS
jgi:hypothetical protein